MNVFICYSLSALCISDVCVFFMCLSGLCSYQRSPSSSARPTWLSLSLCLWPRSEVMASADSTKLGVIQILFQHSSSLQTPASGLGGVLLTNVPDDFTVGACLVQCECQRQGFVSDVCGGCTIEMCLSLSTVDIFLKIKRVIDCLDKHNLRE